MHPIRNIAFSQLLLINMQEFAPDWQTEYFKDSHQTDSFSDFMLIKFYVCI